MDDYEAVQPCEICGKIEPQNSDDKYDDIFIPARPGSQAAALGFKFERLCGRCACAQFIGSYWDGAPGGHHTPIEQYLVGDRIVYVKRDDLWNEAQYGGGNAKLRGAEVHLRKLKEQGIKHVAVMDSKTSRAGWGVAELCRDIGLKCTTFYGRHKHELITVPYDPSQFEIVPKINYGDLPPFQQHIAAAGAQVIAMPASRIYPMFFKARKWCSENGVYLMPMGLQLNEAMLSVAGEASHLPSELAGGTIVCVVATGTMFAGLLLGLRFTAHIIGVYIGMTSGEMSGRVKSNPKEIVRHRIARLLPDGFAAPNYEIVLADREYYDADKYPCPFNCDPWYDRKAWRWLCNNIEELRNPVTFWNIG